MYYFYLIQSITRKDKIYTGSTNNLKRRVREHNNGESFFTKRYAPWKLVYYEAYLSEKDAKIREQKFKRHGKGNNELKKRIQNSLE
ncbi:MAG: GIY-YIG nuclease family protein [bacterium]|nr:GIY-YIG nuclease family protein [bacterium]